MDPCDFLTHFTRFVKIIPLETRSIQQIVIGKQREAGLTPSVSTPGLQCVKKEKCHDLEINPQSFLPPANEGTER